MRIYNRLHRLLPALLATCGSSGPTTIVLNATGFTKDNGKTAKVAVVDATSLAVKTQAMGIVANGAVSFTLDVDHGVMYRVNLFVDSDGNNTCEFGADDVISVTVNPVAEGMSSTVGVTPSQADSQGCLSFGGGTLKVTGTGFPANKIFFAQLFKKDGTDFKKLGGVTNGVTTNGSIDIEFPGGIITQTFYRVDFYVDSNPTNSMCDPSDPAFRVDSGALGPSQAGGELDLTVMGTDPSQAVAVCPTFH